MKTLRSALFALALLAGCVPALAQWQTPNHSVPVGRGAGFTGFNAVGPCAAGLPIVGAGASVDPTCGPLNLGAVGALTGTLPSVNMPNPGPASLGGVQSVTCSAGASISSISTLGAPSCVAATTSTSTVSGAATTYITAQLGTVLNRSNSGAAMSDLLPGTGVGVLPNGKFTVSNIDTAGILSIKVGSGAVFKTATASTGFVYLCPGQSITFYSDGANYWAIELPTRCVFKANTTIFVATTGLATNDGLTVATPVLDPTFAYNLAKNSFDLSGNTITFQLATGTYSNLTLSGKLTGVIVQRFASNVIFLGNAGTPANVVLSDTTALNLSGAGAVMIQDGAVAMFNGFKIVSTNNLGMGVNSYAIIHIQNLEVSTAGGGIQFVVTNSADLIIVGNYAISAGSGCHWITGQGGVVETFIANGTSTITITLTGTPAFTSGFACTQYPSTIVMTTPLAFSGAATGKRYQGTLNGVINTGSAGNPNFFPGNAAGTLSGGAQYL